jgi:hypothetical protein
MAILEELCPNDIMLQQDRVPQYFHAKVMDFLNPKFPEKFNGRSTPITWSPGLPDIIHPTSFLGVNIKDAVYVPPLTNALEDLAGRIRVAVATATLNLPKNMCTETKYRYDTYWATLMEVL